MSIALISDTAQQYSSMSITNSTRDELAYMISQIETLRTEIFTCDGTEQEKMRIFSLLETAENKMSTRLRNLPGGTPHLEDKKESKRADSKRATTKVEDPTDKAAQGLARGWVNTGKLKNQPGFSLNLTQPLFEEVAPICRALGRPQLPMIGSYQDHEYLIADSLVQVKLDPNQIHNLPPSVLQAIGDKKGKVIDMYYLVSDGSKMRKANIPHRNLVMHAWAFPCLKNGTDRTDTIDMGMFEPNGVYSPGYGDALAQGSLKPTQVNPHPKDGLTALSPNNAQFFVCPDAPISSFWTVGKQRDKIVVAQHIIVNDAEHPCGKALMAASRKAGCVKELMDSFAEAAGSVKPAKNLKDSLVEIAALFEANDEAAMKLFSDLPEAYQHAVYFQTWKLHNSPEGLGDFGRDAFHGHERLKEKNSTNAQRAQAIRALANGIAPVDLNGLAAANLQTFMAPASIAEMSQDKIEILKQLMPVIQAFDEGNKDESGFKLFDKLFEGIYDKAVAEKRRQALHKEIFEWTWKEMGCPLGIDTDFGRRSFMANGKLAEEYRCDNATRVHILLKFVARLKTT